MKTSAALAALAGLVLPALVPAQPPPAPVVAPAPAPAPAAVRAAPAAAPARTNLAEQSIYIPYDKLWRTFEKPGRGVFIPYEEFQRLWVAARSNAAAAAAEPLPPVGALVKEATGSLRAGKDVAEGTVVLRVDLLRPGWHEVPLGLRDAGVTRAEIGGQPARLRFDPARGYLLLAERAPGAAAEIEVSVQFARTIEKSPGLNRVAFAPPPCAVSRWEIVIPEPGVKARVFPEVAAAQSPSAAAGETRLEAVVGAAEKVTVEWTPKAEGAVGLEALASVEARQEVVVEEGVTRIRARLAYAISRARLQRLELEAPADFKVVAVQDANVREWRVAAESNRQVVAVELFEAASGAQAVEVELERFGDRARLEVPLVRARNVGRQQGFLAVRLGPGLRADVAERSGLAQIAPAEWPAEWRDGGWPFAFRYAGTENRLVLSVEKVRPRVEAYAYTAVDIDPARARLEYRAWYHIERAGLFKLVLQLPDGFTLDTVEGLKAEGLQPLEIESHYRDDRGELTVNLARQALGDVGLRLLLSRPLNEPDLATPTGAEAVVPVTLPAAPREELESWRSFAVVRFGAALLGRVAEVKGLEQIFPGDGEQWLRKLGAEWRGGYFTRLREPPSLTLRAARRAPYVSVGQLLVAAVEAGRVQYRATFRYDVQYTGVKQVFLDVPADLAPQLKLPAEFAAYRLRPAETTEVGEPAPATNAVRMIVEGPGEFFGAKTVALEWTAKIPDLPAGKSADIPVPVLAPARADHAWGQIAVKKAEGLDVVPAQMDEGLRPIDPARELMAGMKVDGAAQAYEFRGPWALTLRATRYESAEVKATSIERGLVNQVATRSGLVSVQALFKIRSARQRLAVRLPEGAEFDTQPARLNGSPVPLERGEKREFFVPLAGRGPDEAFLLEVRYTLPGAGLRFAAPEFPGEPAIQKVYQSVFLPPELRYLGFSGPWTEENIWVLGTAEIFKRARMKPEPLVRWVAEDVSVDTAPLLRFAADGRQLLFSALRPATGPEAVLSVRAMKRTPWQIAVVAAVLVLGFFILRAPWRRAVGIVAAALIAWALGMVFAPEIASALLSTASVGAAFVVAVVWVVRGLLSLAPRRRGRDAPPPAPPSAPPPAAPPPAPPAPETPPPPPPAGAPESRHD